MSTILLGSFNRWIGWALGGLDRALNRGGDLARRLAGVATLLLVAGVALVGRENIVVCWCEERWRQLLTLMLARTQPGTFAGSIVRRCHEWSAPRQGSERGVQNAEVIPARLADDR